METLNERKSFETMLKSWGAWNALRRMIQGERRSADYDSLYEEASREAVQELTAGKVYSDHIVRMCRREVVPGFDHRVALGETATPGLFFYLQASTEPTRQDWILELAQKETLRRGNQPIVPYRVTHVYRIMSIYPLKMTKSRIGYFRLRVEESEFGGAN